MATLWYGHFDSIAGDQRLLSAAQLAAWITAVMTSGIKNGGTNLQVTAGTGMSVNINVGMANVNGYQMLIKPDTDGSCYNVPLPASNTQYPTIYRIVARLDTDIAVRTVTPQVLISTGVANPAPPALTREDNGIWELSLAQIKVQANATTITNDNIIDERFRTDLCGIINSVFALDPSVWQARFDAFMDSITASGDELTSGLQQTFADWLISVKNNYTSWQTTIDDWKNMTLGELAQVLSFSFDNQFAYPGTIKTTSIDSNVITEKLTYKSTGALLAQQTTTKNADGSITEAQTVYNTDGTVFRDVTATTTLVGGMPQTEVKSV